MKRCITMLLFAVVVFVPLFFVSVSAAGTQTLSSLSVGSFVKFKVDGVDTRFIVVHQGKPSSMYDDSFNDGTILLMENLYSSMSWDTSVSNSYSDSSIHSWLNSSFLDLIDSSVRDQLKTVKIPYRPSSGVSPIINSGSNGLPVKVYLLSVSELGWPKGTVPYMPDPDGVTLDYFSGLSSIDSKRISYYNGASSIWWTRTVRIFASNSSFYVGSDGVLDDNLLSYLYGIRPVLVLPNSMTVSSASDSDGSYTFINEPVGPPQEYSLDVNSGYGGTVSGTASGDYLSGFSVSVTAVPQSGFQFDSWTVEGVTFPDGNKVNPVSFSMPSSDVSLTASFVPLPPVDPFEPIDDRNYWHSVDGFSGPVYISGPTVIYDSVTQIYTINGSTGTGNSFPSNSRMLLYSVGEFVDRPLIGEKYSVSFVPVSGSYSEDDPVASFRVGFFGVDSDPIDYPTSLDSFEEYLLSYVDVPFSVTSVLSSTDIIGFGISPLDSFVFGFAFYPGQTFNNLRFKVQLEKGNPSSWVPWRGDSESGEIGQIGDSFDNIYNQTGSYEGIASQSVTDISSFVTMAAPVFTGIWNVLPAWFWMLMAVSLTIVIGRKILGR